jgi:hypothetical protein
MSYELHITRADFWAENDGYEISSGEWLALIEADAELTRDDRNGPWFAVLGTSGDDNTTRCLDWFEGNINAGYPDRALFEKMLQIAGKLDATVQGDDGDVYTRADKIPMRSPEGPQNSPATSRLPDFLRQQRLANLLIYLLIALVIVAINVFDIW